MLLLIVVSSSLLILQVEDAAESNIKTASDALWWSISTLTTVGYGDRFPVTGEGRIIASLLMVFGLGVFSLVTASVASWMLSPQDEKENAKIEDLIAEIRSLKDMATRGRFYGDDAAGGSGGAN